MYSLVVIISKLFKCVKQVWTRIKTILNVWISSVVWYSHYTVPQMKWNRNCWKAMHLKDFLQFWFPFNYCWWRKVYCTKTNQVAQVLRQAQIMIEDMKLNDVTFVLTNTLDWSFGMAKKKVIQNRSCIDYLF